MSIENRNNQVTDNLATLRFKQLNNLLNRNLDRPITWQEQVAEKVPFFDSYTFRTITKNYSSEPSEIERVRYFAIFKMIEELKVLGYGATAEEILLRAVALHRLS